MIKLLRLLILTITPATFLAAWYLFPGLMEPARLQWLSGIVTILWALELHVFRRLADVSDVTGLSSKEHERLLLRLKELRKRVWWIGAVGLACSALIWLMAATELPANDPLYATLAGFLVGTSLSYLVLVPVWLNEIQSFLDEMKRRAEIEKRRREAIERMSSHSPT